MDAWVLNLDADLELGARGPYTPTRVVREAMEGARGVLARMLLAVDDILVDETAPPSLRARGLRGRAFCPTPRAVALLESAGARVAPHPDAAVLRRVNCRAFCASLGPTLPGARYETAEAAALATLAQSPDGFTSWRIKRAFGMAGRGQRVVTPGQLTRADTELVRAAIATGGLMIEPQVDVVEELAMHGVLDEGGTVEIGAVCTQRTDAHGAWVTSERRAAQDEPARTLEHEVRRVARALHDAGYFGPFGVDAFVYRDARGALAFQPRSEINARYSMGFVVGFDPLRR